MKRCRLATSPVLRASRTSRSISSSANPFKEEREVGFEQSYSMTLGEVINKKYKIVAKLGFGSASRFHLAGIVGLLGPPPLEFLQRSEYSSVYFNDKGKFPGSKTVG